MSGNFDHLSNRDLADKLAGYNLYGTTRTSEIPGPVLLKLIQKRLRESEPLKAPVNQPIGDNDSNLTIFGERITNKD